MEELDALEAARIAMRAREHAEWVEAMLEIDWRAGQGCTWCNIEVHEADVLRRLQEGGYQVALNEDCQFTYRVSW